MKKILFVFILIIQQSLLIAQSNRAYLNERIDTANLNFQILAQQITQNATTNFIKAETLLNWVSNRLEWIGTDYKQRTVKEILARGGGNCFELAKVYITLIDAIHIKYRPIAEINIHAYSEERQQAAEEKVKEYGNKMSVFGKQHNDHRWVEVYDSLSDTWQPIDPSMNVIGIQQWLKARVWFGNRITIDTVLTNDMIVPFAIFVTDSNKSNMIDNRSKHYLITEFDKLYNNKLHQLHSWSKWIKQIKKLQTHTKLAFEGKENLHKFSEEITILANTYAMLKKEFIRYQN